MFIIRVVSKNMFLRFLSLFVIFFIYMNNVIAQKPYSYSISFGKSYTTLNYDSRNLDFKFGGRISFSRRFDLKNMKINIGLEYIQKGANWTFYTIDTVNKETKLYENKKLLELHYVGVPINTSIQLFKSKFYVGLNFNFNYLIIGKKYNYNYDMLNKLLLINKESILNNNSNPFIDDNIKRFESTFGINLIYKPKFIPRSQVSIGFERGLTSIYTLRNLRNNQYYLSYSYLF